MSYDKLLIWQYKGRPKAQATAELLNSTFKSVWDGIASLPYSLDIETATGVNLDLIGKHVGQLRVLPNLAPRELFGFWGVEGAKGFRLLGGDGGRWYREGEPTKDSVVLDDEDYRFLIRCRIAKNYMNGTVENITELLAFIFNETSAVYDQYDMTVSVVVPENKITSFKTFAVTRMDILPRPDGVGIKYYTLLPEKTFGFLGAENAAPFDEGKFAREL